MKTAKNSGIKVNTGVKAAGFCPFGNHNRRGLKVRANVKAGSYLAARNHVTSLFVL